MRARVRRADGHYGELASVRRENGAVAIRVQVGRHLSEWLSLSGDE
jgi:hypothetical protein